MIGCDAEFLASRFRELMRRYTGATPEGFVDVLCPLLIPIRSLDKTILKLPGQSHYRASFTVNITPEASGVLSRGRTGKFVPGAFKEGGLWREIAKGRIIEVDRGGGVASGEIYTGGRRADLERSLEELTLEDLLEIDQYGAAAKVLSGLAEHSLVQYLTEQDYSVRRMPEDMARHLPQLRLRGLPRQGYSKGGGQVTLGNERKICAPDPQHYDPTSGRSSHLDRGPKAKLLSHQQLQVRHPGHLRSQFVLANGQHS